MGAADVDEMVALYDGNLRMADDAVGEVFEAIKSLGRWDDAVLLVTSDHGEALMEHGVQGHNATLYDEMLHVPFILRLPHDRQPPDVDTNRLAILTDVVPTILKLLGLEPRAEVDGVDLLSAPPTAGGRVIFQRRPANRRLGTRTLRWKALFSERGRAPMLFNLRTDPGERDNVVEAHPLLHHGFAALLRNYLLLTKARNFRSQEGLVLPEEDLRQLRALGYLR